MKDPVPVEFDLCMLPSCSSVEVVVTVVAPSDNQSPITRYTILYKPYTVDTWQDAGKETLYGSVTQAMLNGLQPNTIYTIKIRKGY